MMVGHWSGMMNGTDFEVALIEKRVSAVYEVRRNVKSEWGKLYWDNVLAAILRLANRIN